MATKCPACGLQFEEGAFKNCPQCHALIEDAPPAPQTGAEKLPDDEAPPNGTISEAENSEAEAETEENPATPPA